MKTARTSKRLISLLLVIMLLCSLTLPVLADNGNEGSGLTWEKVDNDSVATNLMNQADDDSDEPEYADTDVVRVSIVLAQQSTIAAGYSTAQIASNASAMSYRAQLKAQQDAVAQVISAEVLGGEALDVKWNLTLAANMISANVPYGAIDQIKALDGVKDVVIETRYEPQSASSGSADPNMATSSIMTGSSAAWANGYTGAGSRVAIIDTGLDTDHKSFSNEGYLYSLHQNADKLGMEYNDYVKSLNLLTQAEVEAHWNELNFAGVYSGDVGNTNFSQKVPFGANYVDEGVEITHDKDSQGEHGSHVAGIAAANSYIVNANGTCSPALETVQTQGIAPDAQLLVMKVFGKNGGAYDSDYMAAIEDAIVLGADVVNLSLGSGNAGFATSSTYQDVLDELANSDTVVSISAGNSGMYGDGNLPYTYLYSDGANFATNGSPGSFTNAFTVASVNNDGATGNYFKHGDSMMFYTESSYSNDPFTSLAGELEYVFVDAVGTADDFAAVADVLEGKVAICWRGTTSFYEKAEAAVANGAIATIIGNNQAGTINMDLSDYTMTAPCISILQSDAQAIMANSTAVTDDDGNVLYYTGKITVEDKIGATVYDSEFYTMSDFSSWGVPGSLELKPEITAPGGSIYSVNGAIAGGEAYEVMSGTSMAAPQIAGMSALVAQYIRENGLDKATGLSARQLTQSLLMSTATPLLEGDSDYQCYYSVMYQGAGLANVDAAINAGAYIMMDANATKSAADGKIKAELGDDPDRTGSYSFSFTVNNMTDAAKSFNISSSFFTQDIWAYGDIELLDTWTVPLNFAAAYTVDGVAVTPANAEALSAYDFDGNGVITAADGQALLNYVTGVVESIENLDAADIDADGDVDTYDAYLFFDKFNTGAITVPANGSVKVSVSVQLLDIANYDVDGAWVEGYVFLDELTSADGALGESHSIPVLAYYGGWDEPSMFDVGSYLEYAYGLEDRPPYVYLSGASSLYNQAYIVNYAGDTASYYFGGNPVAAEDTYMPERNAINSENGDKIGKVTFTAVRNAGASRFTVTDEAGNLYADDSLGMVSAAYYYTNGSSWQSTRMSYSANFVPTGIPEGTKLTMSLTLAPEYFVKADGSVDWDSLDENASFSMPVVIDNTAPEISDIQLVKSYKNGTTTIDVTASDNQYIAGVFLYDSEGEILGSFGSDPDAEAGDTAVYSFDLSDTEKYFVQVYDYAANCSTYKLNLNEEEAAGDIAVSLDKDSLEIIKGNTAKLTATVTPWGTPDETVTWESTDENVATVNKNGIVTAVEKGTCTITATSVADPTKYASCEISVVTIPLTFTGVLQDTNGQPQIFTWNMETDKTWTGGAELDSDIASFTYDWLYEVGYQMNTDGYLYTIDMKTGETLDISDSTIAFGAPVDDMDMAYYYNASNNSDLMVGIYGYYLLYSNASDNDFGYGWNLSSYLANYSGASSFTSVAWAGYVRNNAGNIVDVFLLTTDTADIWMVAPDFDTGNASLNFYSTNLDLSWPGYGSNMYCSMVIGDDGNLYLSYFTGDTNELYSIVEGEEDGEYEYVATLLGDVGSTVWPCALAEVAVNGSDEDESASVADKALDIDAKLTLSAKAQALSAGTKAAGGSLNAISGSAANAAPVDKGIVPMSTGTATSDEKTVTVEITAKDADLNAVASTNGLVEISATEALELVSYEVYADYSSVNKGDSLVIGYVDLDGIAADAVVAKLTYKVVSTDNAVVTVKHSQVNNVALDVTETIDMTGEFKHENTEVRNAKAPTCTEDGYSGDIYCVDCGKLVQEGTVIPATNHADDPFNDIAESGYHDYIIEAAEMGIVTGYTDGSYKPNANVTRAQFITMLYRAAGAPEVESTELEFADADDIADPYLNAVAWGVENGIINGYTDGSFKPNENVSRAQMATFLYRYLLDVGYDFGEVESVDFVDANKIAAPYVDAVNAIVSASIMNGVSETEFAPNDYAVRGQVAAVLVRLVNLLNAE